MKAFLDPLMASPAQPKIKSTTTTRLPSTQAIHIHQRLLQPSMSRAGGGQDRQGSAVAGAGSEPSPGGG